MPWGSTPFSWERDAVGFYTTYHAVFFGAAVLYYPVIFGLQRYLRDRPALDLGGADTKCRLNWICLWELGLGVFSVVGAYNVVPLAVKSLSSTASLTEAICGPFERDDPASYWIFLFNLSKVVEFGDTLFVVLRKKPLILLQHYHHLATMLYTWWGTIVVYALNNTNPYFAAMNLCVHTVMYTWYAATRAGWRSPKPLMMAVTLLQLAQMVLGFGIVLVAAQDDPACRWRQADPLGAKACAFMYLSYLVLFAKLFWENYCVRRKKKAA